MSAAGPLAERVRALVLAHGAHACSYQVLDPGVQHWLKADGTAAVGYVARGRTWVAAGAPIAAVADLAAVSAEFAAVAAAARARVVWFLAEASLCAAHGVGADWLLLGAQPVWSPASLCAQFEQRRSLRMQLRRAANKGIDTAEWNRATATGPIDLARCLLSWLRTRRAPPLRFLAGPMLLPDLRDRRVFVAVRDGTPVAYLLLAPIAARRGYLVEQIVRGEHSCNGVSESLLHTAAQALRSEGAALVTLGCAPLSLRCGRPTSGAAFGRALALARHLGRVFYDFDGVDAWKAKFRPDAWEPLYLGTTMAPLRWRDLWALARAEAGGSVAAFTWRTLWRHLGVR